MAEVVRSPLGCTTETPSPKRFTKWCSKNKVLWNNCSIAVSDTTGRCVIAKQPIEKDEIVVEVPDSQVLMAENSQIGNLLTEDGLVKPAEDALLEVQGLILAVMYERALGSKSHWEPYLSFLPNNMSHMPIYWTDSELSELRGTAAYDKIIGRVQHPADAPTRMPQLFDELVLPFVQSHTEVAQLLLGVAPGDVTEEEARKKLWPQYQWATAVVASYSFVLGDEQYQGLVPVWDLLNHVTGRVNVRLHHDADREVLQMIATEDIPAGAEVINCYGQLSNAELLRGYGYVEQHNTIKHVQVPVQFLIRAAAAAAAAANGTTAAAAEAVETGSSRKKQKVVAAAASAVTVGGGGVEESKGLGDDESSDDADVSLTDEDDVTGGDESSEGHDEDHDVEDDSDESSDDKDDDDEEEPDWDLEDDSSEDYVIYQKQQQHQQQQQQQGSIPFLAAAQEQIHDWEDRWQLCYDLKIVPKNNIFQIPSGGLTAVQGNLLVVLLLLLVEAEDCEQLAETAAAATDKAAAAAMAAAEASHLRKPKKGKRQQQQRGDPAAAVMAEAVAKLHALKFVHQAHQLHAALLLLTQLLLSRYTCSLQEDQQLLLEQVQQLPPRLAAAVIARSSEKEVLQQLQQELKQQQQQQSSVAGELLQSAQQALAAALRQRVAAAAAAGHCGACDVPGCSQNHDHDHHHHDKTGTGKRRKNAVEAADSKDDDAEQQQQQQLGDKGSKRKQKKKQKKQKTGSPKAGHHHEQCQAYSKENKGNPAASAAIGAASGVFAFNFQL